LHSADIEVEGEPFTVHHNGGYDGDVKFDLEFDRIEETFDGTHCTVTIPFAVLKELVGRYMISNRIEGLEQVSGCDFIETASSGG